MRKENKNFLYNLLYQALNLLIPLITVPYISRVLGVDNVGVYAYTYSIVYMFMLFGMLGINNYGNRTIASVRDDYDKMSVTFSSIYYMQLIINAFAMLTYFCYLILLCNEYKDIAWIQGIYLISICFDVNWFFFGIEKFKLTIVRNSIIKVLSVVGIFVFVNSKDDLWLYTLIMSVSTLLSQVFLIMMLKKYVSFRRVSLHDIFIHFNSIIRLFVPVLAFGIYKVMDKTMIGAFANVNEVGYYENAEKLMNIPAAIISALGTVMLPRMSYIFSNENADYKAVIMKSMELITKLSAIMFLGLILVANDVVVVMFGNEFKKSGAILIWLSFTVIASAFANVIRTQFLIPLRKDEVYIKSTMGAAVLNLFLNFLLIKRFFALGACIGTIVAEFFVMIYQMIASKDDLEYFKYIKMLLKELVIDSCIVLAIIIFCMNVGDVYLRLVLKVVLLFVSFVFINRNYILVDFLGFNNES